jgi:transposase InsO family protein
VRTHKPAPQHNYHKPKNDAEDDHDFINSIETIIEEFPGYGYRRVTRELHRRVIPVNHKKVQRIMRERGLLRKTKRRFRTDHEQQPRPSDLSHPHAEPRRDGSKPGL